MVESVPAGRYWDMSLLEWTGNYATMPVREGKKILLVPKACVRFRMCLDSQEYYNHFVLNFLQAEHLRGDLEEQGEFVVTIISPGGRPQLSCMVEVRMPNRPIDHDIIKQVVETMISVGRKNGCMLSSVGHESEMG